MSKIWNLLNETTTHQILIDDCQQQLLLPPQPRLEVFKALGQKQDYLQEMGWARSLNTHQPAAIQGEPGHSGRAAASASAPALSSNRKKENTLMQDVWLVDDPQPLPVLYHSNPCSILTPPSNHYNNDNKTLFAFNGLSKKNTMVKRDD